MPTVPKSLLEKMPGRAEIARLLDLKPAGAERRPGCAEPADCVMRAVYRPTVNARKFRFWPNQGRLRGIRASGGPRRAPEGRGRASRRRRRGCMDESRQAGGAGRCRRPRRRGRAGRRPGGGAGAWVSAASTLLLFAAPSEGPRSRKAAGAAKSVARPVGRAAELGARRFAVRRARPRSLRVDGDAP